MALLGHALSDAVFFFLHIRIITTNKVHQQVMELHETALDMPRCQTSTNTDFNIFAIFIFFAIKFDFL